MLCSRRSGAHAGAVMLLAIVGACGGDGPSAPRTGSIAVTSSVQTTLDNNAFNYDITVGSNAPRSVAAGTPASFVVSGIAAGAHAVAVSGLATGCTADAGSRTVNIAGGDTARVTFAITCARTSGDLVVAAATVGPDPDLNGYSVTVDGGIRGTVSPAGNIIVRGLTPGVHIVSLGDLAPNCSTATGTRSATVTAGGTANLVFDVTCRPKTGAIRFTAATTGQDITPVGYFVLVGDDDFVEVSANGSVALNDLRVGQYDIVTVGEASNCAITSAPLRTVTVTDGDTTRVSITGACLGRASTGARMFSATDAVNDTLNTSAGGRPRAFDIQSFAGEYHAEGWVTMTMRLDRPATGFWFEAPNSALARIDIDLDENAATGSQPLAAALGSTVSQGVDARIFVDLDTTMAELVIGNTLVGFTAVQFKGDSITVRFPLSMLNDDGNMSLTAAIGRFDAIATDYIPNGGTILARRPAAAGALSAAPFATHGGRVGPTVSADQARATVAASRRILAARRAAARHP